MSSPRSILGFLPASRHSELVDIGQVALIAAWSGHGFQRRHVVEIREVARVLRHCAAGGRGPRRAVPATPAVRAGDSGGVVTVGGEPSAVLVERVAIDQLMWRVVAGGS